MPRKANPVGPTSRRVAHNITELRTQRGLTKLQLCDLMTRTGRPVSPDVLGNIERARRPVDVDDLVAFATALDTTPSQLLGVALTITKPSAETVEALKQQVARLVLDELRDNQPSGGEHGRR